MVVDLSVFDMPNFDIILGMDFRVVMELRSIIGKRKFNSILIMGRSSHLVRVVW